MPAVMSSTMGRAASAMKWGGASQVGRQLLQLVTLVVLARLLDPTDFGLMGMAAVFVGWSRPWSPVCVVAAMATSSIIACRWRRSPRSPEARRNAGTGSARSSLQLS